MKWKVIMLAAIIPMAALSQSLNKGPHLVAREESLGKLLPGAKVDSLTTDAKFKRVAYVVKRNSKELAVVDGVEGKEYDKVAEKREMYFSPDGKRLAYVAKRGKNSLVVVDGVEGKEYYFIYDLFNPVFSPDSKHLAYVAGTGPNSKWFAVLDGVEQMKYDLVEGLIFSPDSKKLAYMADRNWNRGTCLVVNGLEGRSYSGISDVIFSPDGSRIAFAAFKWHPDRSLAVIDGRDGQEYKDSVEAINAVVFSPDSKHTAYSVLRGSGGNVVREGGNVVVRDGVPGKVFGAPQQHSEPVFSPDSQRLAYVAHDAKWMIVINDKIFDDPQVQEFTRFLTFSPDSQHLAYVTRIDSPTNTGYFAVLDHVVQKDSKNISTAPYFSPDGKRLVYLVRTKDRKEIPAYGEFRGGEYDKFVTYAADLGTKGVRGELRKPFALDQDGTLNALVLRNGELFHLELKVAEN